MHEMRIEKVHNGYILHDLTDALRETRVFIKFEDLINNIAVGFHERKIGEDFCSHKTKENGVSLNGGIQITETHIPYGPSVTSTPYIHTCNPFLHTNSPSISQSDSSQRVTFTERGK